MQTKELQQNQERGRLARIDAAKMAALHAVLLESLGNLPFTSSSSGLQLFADLPDHHVIPYSYMNADMS